MKKYLIVLLMFICIDKTIAVENITIDNNELIPKFDKKINIYNYYTSNDKVHVFVKNSSKEIVINDGDYNINNDKTKIIITSSNNEKYEINVFKNYKKTTSKEVYLENLTIKNHELDFDPDIKEYYINIDNENNLDIDYEISNSDAYVSIEGNGNFNKSDNIIRININNEKEYIIHAYKTHSVFKEEKKESIKEMSPIKKEIVCIIIITISCSLVLFFFYSLFINKSTLHI